jgi:two-component system, NarL family, nitrate/nitrite response regulator NarL
MPQNAAPEENSKLPNGGLTNVPFGRINGLLDVNAISRVAADQTEVPSSGLGITMGNKIRVAVIDPHPIFRDGVVYTLASQADIEIVAQGPTAEDALRIAADSRPDVVVLDASVRGGMDVIETLARDYPMIKPLILTLIADQELVCTALRQGARGYLLKGTSGSELVETVRTISLGECYVSPSLAASLLTRSSVEPLAAKKPSGPFNLTPREEQVLSILKDGHSNKEIGRRLDLSEKTIKHHLTRILQKLKVRNRVEAALMASDHRSTAMSN